MLRPLLRQSELVSPAFEYNEEVVDSAIDVAPEYDYEEAEIEALKAKHAQIVARIDEMLAVLHAAKEDSIPDSVLDAGKAEADAARAKAAAVRAMAEAMLGDDK